MNTTFARVCAPISLGAALLLAPPNLPAQQPAEAPPDDEVVELEAYEVIGTRPYAVDASTLKLPVPVKDLARSVTVLDATRLREQDFQAGSDLLLWVPGINTNGAIQESYHFYARGFRMTANEWRVDGFQGRVIGGSYSPNLFGVDQVTVLKGPAGLLYGSAGSPGGIINLVTKKPRETPAVTFDTRVRTFAGSDSGLGERMSAEFELDATGPITRDGRLLYRALASIEETALPARGQNDHGRFYRFATTYKFDADGRFQVTPLVEWSSEARATRNAVISPASSRTTNDGRTDYTTADVSSRAVNLAAGQREDENAMFGADFTGQLSPAWRVNLSLRDHTRDYANNAWTIQGASLTRLDPADPRSWVISRRHSRARSETHTTSFDANTAYEFTLGARIKSLFQLGVNGRLTDAQAYTSTNGADQSPINIYTGIAATALVADASAVLPRGNRTETTSWNAYAQTQTEFFERLILAAGFGSAGERSRVTAPSGARTRNPDRSGNLAPNLGVTYRLARNASAYASYSTSYSLVDPLAEDAFGRRGVFAPSEGESYEVGAKAALWGDVVAAGIAFFDTELNGVLVQSDPTELNPNGNRFYRQLDTGRKTRGAELELTVNPLPAWETTFTYANLDAFNRNADGSRGAPAEMTPRHAVSVYSRYAFLQGPLEGLTLRAGVIWQSERWSGSAAPSATAPDPLRLDGFYRVDAGVSYRWRRWTVALNIENLTDEYFLLAGTTGLAMSPVNPRSVALRTSRQW